MVGVWSAGTSAMYGRPVMLRSQYVRALSKHLAGPQTSGLEHCTCNKSYQTQNLDGSHLWEEEDYNSLILRQKPLTDHLAPLH